MDNEQVIASVAGTIERVNRLVSVRAVRTRYVHGMLDRLKF